MSDRASVRALSPLGTALLVLPCAAVLAVPAFDRVQPMWLGLPFFYWWQMLWVLLASLFTGMVYKIVVPPGSGD